MSTLHRTATWLALAAVLLIALGTEASAQTRVFVRPNPVVPTVRPMPTQPFPTVGNPHWYQYTNWSAYSNPANYVNYSYLYAATNPYGNWGYNPWIYSYNPYVYNPYVYNPYAYNPYLYGGSPYGYVTPYYGYRYYGY